MEQNHMEQNKRSIQSSPLNGRGVGAARQTGGGVTENRADGRNANQKPDAGAVFAAARFPFLRRLSITSLLAMLVTAVILIFLYQRDQLAEHEAIAAQENEKTATHLIHLMSGQIHAYLIASEGLDARALQLNPSINSFRATLDSVREHHVVKLKIFNLSGVAIFSSAPEEIGGASKHPALLAKALRGETLHGMEFRKTIPISSGELHNRYIANTYMPLTYAEKRIGAIEIYADATPILERIHAKVIQIALVVVGIFTVLYALLFFFVRKADLAISDDTRKLTESETRLRATVDSALDAVISIDAEGLLIGFNPAAEAVFGWGKMEIIGQPMADLLIPERYRNAHREGLARFIETGAARILNSRIEISALRRDGTEFPIELTITSIRECDQIIFTSYMRDITERKQAELKANALIKRNQVLMQNAPDGIHILDDKGNLIETNEVFCQHLGYTQAEALQLSVFDIDVKLTADELRENLKNLLDGQAVFETVHRHKNGTLVDVEVSVSGVELDGQKCLFALSRDIAERKKIESELRIAAKAFESQECMFISDANGIIQRVNRAFTEMTGYSAGEAVGQKPSILKSGRHDENFYQSMRETLELDGSWQGEIWNQRKNGEVYPEWQVITAVTDLGGQVTHYIYTFSDISKRKEAEEQIISLAFYDPLTKLPNRRLLVDKLKQTLVINARNKRQGALLFIDLDNFKNLNDTQGHDTGDQLLIEAATRLQASVRQGDTVARLGGDEFVVLLDDLDTDEATAATQTETIGEKIRSALGQHYLLDGHEYHSTASIGATLLRGPVITADEMLRRADVGLYQAKAGGRNTLRFFDPALQELVMARVAMEADLRRAVSFNAVSGKEQFQLHYQPQIDSSGCMIGSEALVRWRHPERGMISPAEFIPLAEETGLILPLGHWVLTTACQQLAIWATRPEMAHLTVAVNVSARQFSLPNFVEEVLALVDYHGVNAGNLKLEITESMLLDNVDIIVAKMTALKAKGIYFSLDDFGTGYSSLSYLKRLPLYQLKIDQSFVRDVLTDPNDAAIAKTIVALSQSMGLAVIAEGVETEGQRDFLALQGCHNYQGYFFSRPLPIEQFDVFASSLHSANGAKLM
jgi:diguanylate cyclase (GGDEF)-like protein/PAS domain S-box-containing protein